MGILKNPFATRFFMHFEACIRHLRTETKYKHSDSMCMGLTRRESHQHHTYLFWENRFSNLRDSVRECALVFL